MGGSSGPLTRVVLENILSFDLEENSFSAEYFGYAKKRAGSVISPGKWELNVG